MTERKISKIKIICQICKKETVPLGMPGHLRKHNMSTKEYYDKYLKKSNEGICYVC